MRANENPVERTDPDLIARGTTQRNATGPASEHCEHGDSGKTLSNEAEGKLFRPDGLDG